MSLKNRMDKLEKGAGMDKNIGRVIIYDPKNGIPEIDPEFDGVVVFLPDNKRENQKDKKDDK